MLYFNRSIENEVAHDDFAIDNSTTYPTLYYRNPQGLWKKLSISNVTNDLTSAYLEYSVLMTQASTAAPTVVSLQDAFSPTLARTGTGVYTITKTGAFTSNKTLIPNHIILGTTAGANRISVVRTNANVITISTFGNDGTTPADGVLSSTPINFKVYN